MVLGAAGACAKPAPEPPSGDTLVLEVGGQQSSLRESLRSMGKEVAPPHAPVLKPYLAETPAGVRCVASGKLPPLNDDGESDEDDSSSRRVVQDAFRGFAYAGDD